MLHSPIRCACLFIAIVLLSSLRAQAQLPFYTDDADTTPKGKVHVEFSNEQDWLQRSSFPGRRQSTTVFTFNYGITNRIEADVNAPLISIYNDRTARFDNASGIGDTQFGVKIRVLEEHESSKVPAASVVFYVEAPTGSVRKQIGSGLTDYWLYGVLQKSFTKRTTGRLNGGVLFSGNDSTGLVGIETTRGQVFTGNGSLVRQFTPRLSLGAELFGAVTNSFKLNRGQLTGQVGGQYNFTENFQFTFGVITGRFAASPRLGAQVGVAYDFK
jgi:outer membrane putative beta-barrel porin/alpha-amylase